MNKQPRIAFLTVILLLLSPLFLTPALANQQLAITAMTDKNTYPPSDVVKIDGNVTEAGAPKANVLVAVEVRDPRGAAIWNDIVSTNAAGKFSSTFRLAGDAFVGTYTAYVAYATASKTVTFTVISDLEPPKVVSVSTDTFYVKAGGAVKVTVIATDNIGMSSVVVDGVALTLTSGSTRNGTWTGSVKAPSAEAVYTITAKATDLGGNAATGTATYSVDATVPGLIVNQPKGGETFYKDSIMVELIAFDALSGIDTVTVNGKPATLGADGVWRATITLVSGSNDIVTVVTDKTGNSAKDTRTVTFTLVTKPGFQIQVTAPSALNRGDKAVVHALATVEGSPFEVDTLSATWSHPNGTRMALTFVGVAVSPGLYSATIDSDVTPRQVSDGTHTIIVTGTIGSLKATTSAVIQLTTVADQLILEVMAPSIASPGQRVNIFLTTTYKGAIINASAISAHVWQPGNRIALLPAPTRYVIGHYNTTFTVPTAIGPGTYWVHARAAVGQVANYASVPITVVAPLATADSIAALSTKVDGVFTGLSGRITEAQSAITTSVTAVGSRVDSARSAIESAVGGVKTAVDGVSGAVGGVRTAVDGVRTAVDGVARAVSDVKAAVDGVRTAVDGVATAVGQARTAITGAVSGAATDVKNSVTAAQGEITKAIDAEKKSIDTLSNGLGQVSNLVLVTAALSAIAVIIAIVILARMTRRMRPSPEEVKPA